jgi:hypothetical protein
MREERQHRAFPEIGAFSSAECYHGIRQGCKHQSYLQQGAPTHLLFLTGLLARLLSLLLLNQEFYNKFRPTVDNSNHWTRTFRAKFID